MAENAPPNEDDTRGVPYYEKLKRDVRDTMSKKRVIDKNLTALEEQIFRFEGSYLEETGAGNIIKGFDNYIKGSGGVGVGGGGGGGGTSTRRKGGNMEQDRVFSRSSVSYMRESSPSSAISTPAHAATPTSGNASGAPSRRDSDHPTPTGTGPSHKAGGNTKRANKKSGGSSAAVDKDEDDDGKPNKRLKITYGRGDRD